jgi:RNA polymerase sigma factor (sigma-70 family)
MNPVKETHKHRIPYQFPKGYEILLRGLPKKQLTLEEEHLLSIKIQKSKKKDVESINELAMHAMREAFYYGLACAKVLSPEEIFSLCYIALRASAGNFKPGRVRFFAYSKPYVRGEVCKTFEALKVVRNATTQALDSEYINGGSEIEDYNPTECQIGPRGAQFDARLVVTEDGIGGIMAREEWKLILPILQSKLSEKERMVLELRYQSGFNFRQIGDLLSVSRSDTQATHERAINKVRCALRGKRSLFCR